MTTKNSNIDLYKDAATHVLAGFQLVEERLKDYIGYYYGTVRILLVGKIAFTHQRQDVENYSLERLTVTFSKITSNDELVKRIRSLINTRNDVAHRSLVLLYSSPKPDSEYKLSIDLFVSVSEQLAKIMEDLVNESVIVREVGINNLIAPAKF